jgi:hypothetical protein
MTLSPKVDYTNGYKSSIAAAAATVFICSANGQISIISHHDYVIVILKS